VSLMEHRNAASRIIKTVWTPATMAETSERRTVCNWFMHFDLLAALMAGHEPTCGPEWSWKNREVIAALQRAKPDDLVLRLEEAMCAFRDLSLQISQLTADRAAGVLTIQDFGFLSEEMLKKCFEWRNDLHPSILEGAETVHPSSKVAADVPVCPFKPAPLYKGDRWAVNFLILDYYGIIIVLKHQIASTSSDDHDPSSDPSLQEYAIKICEILAAIEAYTETPRGSLLAAQAPIGLAALWLPDRHNYRRWMQYQLAKEEKMG